MTGGLPAGALQHGISRFGFHGPDVHSYRFRTSDGSGWHVRNGGTAITVRKAKF